MCVIIAKIKGSDFAPIDIVEKCFVANPDGFSMAWNQNGELKVFKTMDMNEALDKYRALTQELNAAETGMIIHARIKSHGSIKLENCHCWEHNGVAFAHNGILRNIRNRDDMTDSETFFRDFFIPAWDGVSFEFALKLSRAVIGDSNNKFALINANGEVFLTDGDAAYTRYTKLAFPGCRGKIYFSNTIWMPHNHYSSALGFNPYEGVKSTKTDEKNKKAASGKSVPDLGSLFVGPRKPVAPARPLAVSRQGGVSAKSLQELQEAYDNIHF